MRKSHNVLYHGIWAMMATLLNKPLYGDRLWYTAVVHYMKTGRQQQILVVHYMEISCSIIGSFRGIIICAGIFSFKLLWYYRILPWYYHMCRYLLS